MKEIRKLGSVDTMRGIAVLMVILVHTSGAAKFDNDALRLFCNYGQMGVQLFFVASAFTLCNSGKARSDEPNKTLNYFIRRFFRIAPLYYVGIVAYFSMSLLYNLYKTGVAVPADQYTPLNIASNVLFVHGFYPPASNNIVPGGWSISTEMAFYCLFPLIFPILDKAVSSWFRAMACFALFLLASLAAIRLLDIALGLKLTNNGFVYFNLVVQLPVFILGIIYFKLDRQGLWPRSIALNLAGFVALSIVALLVLKAGQDRPELCAILPEVAAFSFLFLFGFLREDRIINNAIVQRIGMVSYSMYIFHFVFSWNLLPYVCRPLYKVMPGSFVMIFLYVGSVLATFAVALVSERCIEKPFIHVGRRVVAALASPTRRLTVPDASTAAQVHRDR